MRFAKLEDLTGSDVFINPDHVVTIEQKDTGVEILLRTGKYSSVQRRSRRTG